MDEREKDLCAGEETDEEATVMGTAEEPAPETEEMSAVGVADEADDEVGIEAEVAGSRRRRAFAASLGAAALVGVAAAAAWALNGTPAAPKAAHTGSSAAAEEAVSEDGADKEGAEPDGGDRVVDDGNAEGKPDAKSQPKADSKKDPESKKPSAKEDSGEAEPARDGGKASVAGSPSASKPATGSGPASKPQKPASDAPKREWGVVGTVHHEAVYEQRWVPPVTKTEKVPVVVGKYWLDEATGNKYYKDSDVPPNTPVTPCPIVEWRDQTVTVAEGYYDSVLVSEAWDEPVYGWIEK